MICSSESIGLHGSVKKLFFFGEVFSDVRSSPAEFGRNYLKKTLESVNKPNCRLYLVNFGLVVLVKNPMAE